MDVQSTLSAIEELIALKEMAIIEAIYTTQLKCQNVLHECFLGIFNEHPELKAVAWYQATAEWNDGEECVFAVHSNAPTCYFHSSPGVGWEWDEWIRDANGKYVPMEQADPLWVEKKAASDKVSHLLSVLGERVLLHAFGDSTQITVDRNGFAIDEWKDE